MRPLPTSVLLILLVGVAASGAVTSPAGRSPETSGADPEDIRRQMEMGRYWHASQMLGDTLDSAGGVTPSEVLLLARAEAGWTNWPRVASLLRGRAWLDHEDGGAGWYLLARAAEETGQEERAVDAYRRFLRAPAVADDEERAGVARIRRARLLSRIGASVTALEELERVEDSVPWASEWLALDLARASAERGEVEIVREALARSALPGADDRRRRLEARALRTAGDTAGALDAYLEVARRDGSAAVRSRSWGRIGGLRLALGDTAAARAAFRNGVEGEALDLSVARGLLSVGLDAPRRARLAFEALEESGDPDEALEALEAYRTLRSDDGGDGLDPGLRLRWARLLSRAERRDEAVEVLRDLADLSDPEVAGPALDLWGDVRRAQGRHGDARTLQNRLVERFPARPEAVDVVYFRADDRHDRGDLASAAAGYRRIVEVAPELDRAGLARMRLGQIQMSRGRYPEAAEVFEGYLEAFPRGRRWDEAAFWAARSRSLLGQDDSVRALVSRIRDGDPLSYYAVLSASLLDDDFAPDVPEGDAPPEVPWISEAVDRARMLREAGLPSAADAVIEAAADSAEDSDATLLRLSTELSEGGFAIEGIQLAWRIRARGRDWDRRLLRAVYPFPYRELVQREAREWGVPPHVMAAIVRQESAFVADIRSGAGAVGLMQVLPATGRSLARSVGPSPFEDRVLSHPEVNLHLGGAYLAGLLRRFDDDLPLVLSAYNAGPTRTSQWSRRFPEVEDPLRFTERIPYAETRDYVKRVRRNVAIYRWLYNDPPSDEVEEQE